ADRPRGRGRAALGLRLPLGEPRGGATGRARRRRRHCAPRAGARDGAARPANPAALIAETPWCCRQFMEDLTSLWQTFSAGKREALAQVVQKGYLRTAHLLISRCTSSVNNPRKLGGLVV